MNLKFTTLGEAFDMSIEAMEKIGFSKKEIAEEVTQIYNEIQDMKFSIVPFGKKLAKRRYIKIK